jgi:hypothetical protein
LRDRRRRRHDSARRKEIAEPAQGRLAHMELSTPADVDDLVKDALSDAWRAIAS